MEGQCKEKEGVWTTQNIRQECNYWTLEADAELLKHLQQFSQKLLLETHTALKSLDVLESQLNTTYVKFSTVSNSFLALSDTQFIENRVYEDEETSNLAVPSKIPEDTSNKNEDTVIIEKLKKAINNGFKVLNDKFETIKVPESDSEDDEDDSSVKSGLLLKPINPYEDLVLPYLIGSAEFNSDDTVGLEDVASENEIEEVLSESDQISESEDSEPESDQTKVQTIEVVDQDDIFRYKQVSLAEEALLIRDSSHENQLNSRGQNFFGTLPDNKNNRRTSSEIKASVVKDITSCDQSVTSSASSNEFVDRGIHDIDQDEAGQSFNDTDETDNLFEAPPSFKPQKIPAGGVSVLRPGVQLPPAKSTLKQTSSITDKEKQKPKHNHLTRNNTDYGSLSEDDPHSTSIFRGKTISKNEISYSDNDDDDHNLFRKTDHIDEIRSTKNEKSTISSSEIFSDLRSNKLSKFHSVSNNEFKKSFWLDSEKDLMDNSDNFFDSKLIFSDDDDDDDFLFSANEQTNFMNKKDTIVSGKSKSTNVIDSQSDNQVRIGEPSIFTENDMLFSDKSSSKANFFNVVTDTDRMPNIDKLSKNVTNGEEKMFNYLFDDFTDEEDLFKDILPTKNDTTSERHKTQNELIKPIDNPNLNTEKKPLPNIDDFENNEDLFKDIPTIKNVTATKQIKPINTPNLNTEKKALPNIDDLENNEDLFKDILSTKNVTATKQIKPINTSNLNTEKKALPNIDDLENNEDLFKDILSTKNVTATKQIKPINTPNLNTEKKALPNIDDFENNEDLFKDILPIKNVTASKQTEQVKPITNLNLKIEKKPLPNIVDFKDTEDLFSDSTSSNHSLFTGSSLEDDFHKKGGHLFDDFGSDEDLFSFSTNSVDSKNSSVSNKLSQEIKPPKKGLFDNQEFSPSYNDGSNVLGSTSESNIISMLGKHISNNNVQPQQLILRDPTAQDSITSPDDSISNNTMLPTQFTSASIFNTILMENEKKSKSFTSDEPTQERTQIKSMINKIEHPITLSVGQSTVKSDVIISSHETSDGAVFTSSLRPSPGKLSADLLLNIDPTTLLPGSRPTFTEREELLPSDTVSTLQSVIKERPKIQVKRRPPSRKARQEAIRVSKLEEDEEDYTSKSDLINTNLEPSFISSSTDGDNLCFNSNEAIDKITSHSLNIFDTPTEISSNLLNNKPSVVNENSTRSEGRVSQPDNNILKVEENKLLKHTNITVEEDLKELVVKSGNIIFDGESDDDLFGEISTTKKNVYLSRSESDNINDVDNEWLSSGATETEDFLFPQNMTNVSSSQSTKIKTSLVQPTLLKQDKSITTTIHKDIFGEESLDSTNKEPKIRQIPKTNFLFDDEDGELDMFSQSINVTSSQVQTGRTSELGTLTKVSGHSTQKVKLSSQQVFTDPLMSIKNVD